jgi:hypothetical protein
VPDSEAGVMATFGDGYIYSHGPLSGEVWNNSLPSHRQRGGRVKPGGEFQDIMHEVVTPLSVNKKPSPTRCGEGVVVAKLGAHSAN